MPSQSIIEGNGIAGANDFRIRLREAWAKTTAVGLKPPPTPVGKKESQLKDCSEAFGKLKERKLQPAETNLEQQRDTSARRCAPDRLQDGRILLRIAGRLSRMGAWSLKLPEFKLRQSEMARDLQGMPPGLTLEESIEYYAPEFRESIIRAFEVCVCDGTPFDLELQTVTATGRRTWVRFVGEAVRDADGAIQRVEGVLQDVSDRRQSEEESRQLAERLTTTLESITDAFFTLDRDWRFTFLNSEAERLLRRPRTELLGRDWRKVFSDAVDSGFGSEYRQAMAGNQTVEFEEFYPPLKAWFAVRAYPSKEGVAVYFLDITERKRASAMLIEGRQRLALATESARIGIWDWDVVANKMVWDAQMYELYGIREEEFSGAYNAWQIGLHPEDLERGESEIAAALDGARDFDTEFRVVWPNGEVRDIEAHGIVQRAGDGSPTRMIGVNWDITKRKRSEQALERARQRLYEAQRIGLIGDWEWDLATQVITWSPQVFEILGRDPNLGQPRDFEDVASVYDAASKALMEEKVARAIETGEAQQYELLATRPDGVRVHLEAMTVPGRDKGGRVVRLHGTVQDISARMRGEQALQERALQQELIAILGRSALGDADLDRVFLEAAAVVAKGLNVRYSAVMQLMASDRSFVLKAGAGWESGWLHRRISCADGDLRLVAALTLEKPVIVDDFASEPPTSTSEILRVHGIASGIDLPIVCSDGPWGVLGGYSREARKFSAENLDFLRGIANILASAIDRKRREAQLVYLAHHDSLTDLPNRVLLNDRLAVALSQALRWGTRLAVMYLDLDQFKNVNDAFGHNVGDRLLQEVARRLTGSLRASDTVSRVGGDEFLMVLPELGSDEDAARVGEKLIRSMEGPVNIGGLELLVTASLGIACFPQDGTDAKTLVRNADAAMFAAKETGRSCHRFYSVEMNSRADERVLLQADLGRAVARDELFLQFQPQVDMGTGAVTGVEALVRWRHPTLGIVAPGRFIPIAEESGLIISIGAWVLEAACRQQAQWVRDGIARGRMAVNVSAIQFRQAGFFGTVVQTLAETGLEASRLELELTESVVMHGIKSVREKLTGLSKLGVRLSIDDFGTGQSNLSYLKQFSIHRLKIDRSFIIGLPEDKENGALAQAIVSMAHALGMNVIAEGIETEAQAEFLQSMWCDDAQGFFYSRPLFPADCVEFLRNVERRQS